jgi:CRP/FNR family nitrogen fixation transcriptional regulator
MHTELSTHSVPAALRQIGLGYARPSPGAQSGMTSDALGVDGVRMSYDRNAEIFGEGEPAACVYRVLKGVVRTYRILSDGRRQVAEFFLPGDLFGLEACDDHRASAEAVIDCELVSMLVLGRKNACERLAWFLIDMSERIPAPDRVDLPMSRQDIADYLGLTIETVSRTMTQLQDDSMIALPSCRHVVLRDRQGLVDLAA